MAGRSFILWLHGLGDSIVHQRRGLPPSSFQRPSSDPMAGRSSRPANDSFQRQSSDPMAGHSSRPANEPIRTFFSDPEFKLVKWSFPSAPLSAVSFNSGAEMPSWFDISEIPVTPESPRNESDVLKAVQNVHAMIDKEVEDGVKPENIFVCGFCQGGALTLASALLYPKTLGGGAIFSGWVPFNSSIIGRISPDAKKTPILWSHGTADEIVLFESAQAGPPFLEQAGMSCEFKAYPNVGHSMTAERMLHLESWIKARLKSSS